MFPQFYLIWQIILLLVLLDMTNKRRSPASMIAWLLIIFSIPYLGVILYLLIGRRKIVSTPFKDAFSQTKKSNYASLIPIESILHHNGIPPATDGNRFTLITDGNEAYGALMEAIKNAQHSIYFATYIFSNDIVIKTLSKKLIEKARSGIDVRILIDAFGSLPLYLFDKPLQPLLDAGVKIEFFMPLRPFWSNTHINLRLHRKIYLFDNQTVFSGGMNLSHEYIGPDDSPLRWNDLLFSITGPAAAYYHDIFASDWNFTTDQSELLKNVDKPLPAGKDRLQVVPSGPDIATDALYDALMNAIFNAKERIWIVTPYFIPNDAMMSALRIAHIKGVDIKLITPEKTDHVIYEVARSGYMREINEWGGDVALYKEKMLHAKAIIIDNSSVMVGTLNFDQRSLFLNYEIVSIGYSPYMIKRVDSWMRQLLLQSRRGLRPTNKYRKLLENLGRIIAPQL